MLTMKHPPGWACCQAWIGALHKELPMRIRTALAAATFAAGVFVGSVAQAVEVTATYNLPSPGVALNFGWFGYTDPNDNFIQLAGYEITHTRIVVDFVPDAGNDPTTLYIGMAVPVTPFDPNGVDFIEVSGSSLVETTPGVFHYELDTEAYDGIARSGRFSLEVYGLDPVTFEPVPLSGTFLEGSGIFFTVDGPEPLCPADFNAVDGVTADDIFAFLDSWFVENGEIGAGWASDFDDNEEVNADDIFAFLDAWFTPCP
jgi:hypothetical protein